MKKLITILALLITSSSAIYAANEVKLVSGDLSISTIERGEILSKDMFFPNCPLSALCQPATQIKVQVFLNGCLDRLGPVSHSTKFNEATGSYELTISAINIATYASTTARCFAPPSETVTINVAPDLLYSDIELKMMN